MTETTVTTNEDPQLDQATHATAVAEGAAAVHSQISEGAAAEAKVAADVATEAAVSNARTSQEVQEAKESAEAAATVAAVSAEQVYQALQSQAEAIQSVREMLEVQNQPAPMPEKTEDKTEKPPKTATKKKKGSWYVRKLGG